MSTAAQRTNQISPKLPSPYETAIILCTVELLARMFPAFHHSLTRFANQLRRTAVRQLPSEHQAIYKSARAGEITLARICECATIDEREGRIILTYLIRAGLMQRRELRQRLKIGDELLRPGDALFFDAATPQPSILSD